MKKLKIMCVSAALLLSSYFYVLPVGFCSETSQQTTEVVSVSKADLLQLKQNNEKQNEILKTLKQELMTAKTALQTSNRALTEAQYSLKESQSQNQELQIESTKQKQETQKLSNQLTQLSTLANNAQNSINLANQYLQDTRNEYRTREAEHQKTENKLKSQKNVWQTIASLSLVYAIVE